MAIPQQENKTRGRLDSWIELGKVVYAWTDRRNAEVDRVWWKTAGARFYWTAVPPAPATNASVPNEVGAVALRAAGPEAAHHHVPTVAERVAQ
jgi:hypothetical protein